jgi:hypothetical protein
MEEVEEHLEVPDYAVGNCIKWSKWWKWRINGLAPILVLAST